MKYFKNVRNEIDAELRELIEAERLNAGRINRWGDDLCTRIYSFASTGKMLRGALVMLAHDLFGGDKRDDALRCAAAMELFQSAFLIHDDIMDSDEMRRGSPSIFAQYEKESDEHLSGRRHYGESMAICAGDVAFFWGYKAVSGISDPVLAAPLLSYVSGELAVVGAAQMQDVYAGFSDIPPPLDDIMNLYLTKTGRYTFSMPLTLGVLVAGGRPDDADLLSRLGEKLGVIFQIKDDELGLFGDSTEIGKVAGSDIRENKKSIYRHYLFERITGEDRTRCEALFGSDAVTDEDILYVRMMIIESGVRELVGTFVDKLALDAEKDIAGIKTYLPDNAYTGVLDDLLAYSVRRKK